MRFQSLLFSAVVVSIFVFAPESGYGQSQAAETVPQPSATSAQPAPSSATPAATAKPVKVWDNDEIGALRNGNGISVVGNQSPQKVSRRSRNYSQEKDPAWYRKQLTPLRAEIDKLDGQIDKLRAFMSGEKVNEQATMRPQVIPSLPDQLKEMEEKRAKDVEAVNDLMDRARHNDIDPGELR